MSSIARLTHHPHQRQTSEPPAPARQFTPPVIGNQARLRLQAKLEVGAAADPAEREADAAADRVMRQSTTSLQHTVQRKCGACQLEDQAALQRQGEGGDRLAGTPVPESVPRALAGPGQKLDDATRTFMESGFGHDFSSVRIHNDSAAADSARDVAARAYTLGNQIAFSPGAYRPASPQGRRLLAHELAHVVQQGATQPTLRRYGHDQAHCEQEDLEKCLWPGDMYARRYVASAIQILNTDPLPSYVPPLLQNYFMTTTPDLAKIKQNFAAIQAEVDQNDYFYDCVYDCKNTKTSMEVGKTKVSYLLGGSGPIILCMNSLRDGTVPEWLTGHTIVHEFAHRYLDFTGDPEYCAGACTDITPAQALKNPDSYASLAQDIYDKKTIAELKKARAQKPP